MALYTKIKRNDTVRVLRGKDAGKRGKVLAVLPQENRLVVEDIAIVKKHVKARQGGQKGQRVTIAAPIPAQNVQLICTQCKKGTRIGITRENGIRQRMCKQCNSIIE